MVKQLYGGIGKNFLNPALAGRAFLLSSYSILMSTWAVPKSLQGTVDGVTMATPLSYLYGDAAMPKYFSFQSLFLGNTPGSVGEVSTLILIAACIYLIVRKVISWERSLKFYDEALGLKPVREKNAADGSFKIVFLGDGVTDFRLELTWMTGRTEAYDLGEQEYHLAFRTDDMEAAHKKHEAMGCICYENPSMGIYFLEDPDGYWIEIIPTRK